MTKAQTKQKLGFGTYRTTHRSDTHRKSLLDALEAGCCVIDTSSNYTDGESEELIGEVLESSSFDPLVITKAGYIQGRTMQDFLQTGLKAQVVKCNSSLWHSIDPLFLETQIQNSLKRLRLKKLPVFLLHNPEYYFESENPDQDEFYLRIETAVKFLEEKKQQGIVESYGISSNNLILSSQDPKKVEIERIWERLPANHSFKYLQFPFNLLEQGALDQDRKLLNFCKEKGIITIANRPLNAFKDQGLTRLAIYNEARPFDKNDEQLWKSCIEKIQSKFQQNNESDFNVLEIPLLQQIGEIWKGLPTPDAVEQVFFGHFFPFLAKTWGEKGVPKDESQIFYDLFDRALELSRWTMSQKSQRYMQELLKAGELNSDSTLTLSQHAVQWVFDQGVDIVLVGMKSPEYVKDMGHFFK